MNSAHLNLVNDLHRLEQEEERAREARKKAREKVEQEIIAFAKAAGMQVSDPRYNGELLLRWPG